MIYGGHTMNVGDVVEMESHGDDVLKGEVSTKGGVNTMGRGEYGRGENYGRCGQCPKKFELNKGLVKLNLNDVLTSTGDLGDMLTSLTSSVGSLRCSLVDAQRLAGIPMARQGQMNPTIDVVYGKSTIDIFKKKFIVASKSTNGGRGNHETKREYPMVPRTPDEWETKLLPDAQRSSRQKPGWSLLDGKEDCRDATITRLQAEMTRTPTSMMAQRASKPTFITMRPRAKVTPSLWHRANEVVANRILPVRSEAKDQQGGTKGTTHLEMTSGRPNELREHPPKKIKYSRKVKKGMKDREGRVRQGINVVLKEPIYKLLTSIENYNALKIFLDKLIQDGYLREFVDSEKTKTKEANVKPNPRFNRSGDETDNDFRGRPPPMIGGPNHLDLENWNQGEIHIVRQMHKIFLVQPIARKPR
ncbi:hypothetical protein Acr_01g0005650 [Actinidia rufa]|uniref:Uncharacterized protein n=1 Tax=Actinidia rufa TaxID=165716 RepID=A0A7J0E3N6_9ERIC|nr:hypothetical protein Acr_01g0005650 [Actinidia rufa]